ncbi:MAG: DUF937 domain-containing protein [Burkholderiaceae bacterium]|nr:MAG: DUF937 domain-containing protein [Burkholderiaceae bacterium]
MFEVLVREAGARFGLGDKGLQMLQMLLSLMTNKDSGGLAGFLEKFKAAGLGPIVQSWLGGGPSAQAVSNGQLEQALGSSEGVIALLTRQLGLARENVTSALGYLIPALVGKLTPGGNLPSALPPEISGMAIVGRQLLDSPALGRAPGIANGGGLGRWLPWIVVAALILLALAYCSQNKTPQKPAVPAAPNAAATTSPAAASSTPSNAAATAAAAAAPQGATVVASTQDGKPTLAVYFESGKTDVAADFPTQAVALVQYLRDHAGAQVMISGFNDAGGDVAKNAELSKARAKAVQAALVMDGVDEARTKLEKPADATGTAATAAASRRVDVTVRD